MFNEQISEMSNNKQSSVLFLWQELKHWLPERYTVDDSVKILSILNQAVEMHKEEILSFNKLLDKHEIDAWTNNTILLTAEEFYNETFGGGNK